MGTGQQGAIGPQGPRGEVGPQGPTGRIGPLGPAGQLGPIGPTGPKGPIGPKGSQGLQGPIGITGTMGPVGLMGFTGTVGPIGLTGPQGARGEMGPIGPPGKDSLPVDVASKLLAQNDFLNSLASTLTDKSNTYYKELIGAQGPVGPQGPQGPKGDPGSAPSASAVASGLIGLGNSFVNTLSNSIINSATGTQFANNVANAISETAANNFTTLLYNQMNNSVGNTFLNNLQYKLQNDKNFNLSLADSLSSSTYGNNLSGLIYDKINISTSGNSVISKLAQTIVTNPDYQTLLQGKPGDIYDSVSVEKSLIPKTMWCSNGTFANALGTTTGELICRTPFSTGGSLYQIGDTPVYDSTKGSYLTPSGMLKIGDWILAQNLQGDLVITNIDLNTKKSINTDLMETYDFDTSSINSGAYIEPDNNTRIIDELGRIVAAGVYSNEGIYGRSGHYIDINRTLHGLGGTVTNVRGSVNGSNISVNSYIKTNRLARSWV